MTLPVWFTYTAGAVFIIAGVLEIITKRCFFLSSKKYTEASMRDFAKYDGIVEILFGPALMALNFGETGRKACLILVIGALLIYGRQSRIYLKKKQNH